MKKFLVSTEHPYEIIIDKDIIPRTGEFLKECFEPCKVCIVTDSNVNKLYSEQVYNSLINNGFTVTKIVFPAGEHAKSIKTYSNILEALASDGFTRSDVMIALGGGIVGDITGFAAATYMRGIQYIQIPTTYVSTIDSSIGGKTSVNLLSGKNLVGCFWQPKLVLCDYSTFKTLSPASLLDGRAEAVKNAFVSEANLIKHIQEKNYESVIERCISIKKSIVEADERDTGLRQLLNFGHTVGHGIEKISAFSISHGQAVAKGMLVEAKAAARYGLTSMDVANEIEEILENLGFDLSVNYSAKDLYYYSLTDKKIFGDTINMIVPEAIGRCKLHKLPLSELEKYISLGL